MEVNHKFQMNIATQNLGKPIANIHRKSIRNRILDAILGKQNRVLIIVPDGCVENIVFTEMNRKIEKTESEENNHG